MNFHALLREAFEGAIEEADFCRNAAMALQPLGFTKDTALVCIATCRDEISQSWVAETRERWGDVFNLAGLGGMIFAGKTGFGAALSHAPISDGRERFVFFAGPHIGIGREGEPGLCDRDGRQEPSYACGALLGLLGELKQGKIGATDDPDDPEQGLIRSRLGGRATGDSTTDLFALTRLAHQVIDEDLDRLLAATLDTAKADYAVMTGIQIHGPEMRNYIQPGSSYAVVNGARRDVEFG